jgi:hypothetical protein
MLSEYNVPLIMKCLEVVARHRKMAVERIWDEFVEYDNSSLYCWEGMVRSGALLLRTTDAFENGSVLAHAVYYRDLMLVELALLLGAQLGEHCTWTVWPSYPKSKCLLPFGKAYYSEESGAGEIVAMIDAKFPCH